MTNKLKDWEFRLCILEALNSVQKTQKSGLDNHPLWTAAICYHLGVLVLII